MAISFNGVYSQKRVTRRRQRALERLSLLSEVLDKERQKIINLPTYPNVLGKESEPFVINGKQRKKISINPEKAEMIKTIDIRLYRIEKEISILQHKI